GWGLPAFVLVKILKPAFFARQDTRAPMIFALISVGVNIALGVALFHTLGYIGLAAATSIATWITVAQMGVALHRRKSYSPSAGAWARLARIGLAAAGMGAFLAFAASRRPELEGLLGDVSLAGLHAKELTVLAVCLAGAVVYGVLLFALGGLTRAEIRAALRRRAGASPGEPDLS
ncbi:MAG: lipid II flippase MurJ, partial [Phenylobacterium sp.]